MFDAWPYAHEIWLTYLKQIISRYADSKVERIRDLFNQVLTKAPPKQAKVFFYMYADYEENFGLLTHAMEIYDKAAKEMSEAGLQDQCYEVVNLQIAKSAEYYGVSRTRQLFERAIQGGLLKGTEGP